MDALFDGFGAKFLAGEWNPPKRSTSSDDGDSGDTGSDDGPAGGLEYTLKRSRAKANSQEECAQLNVPEERDRSKPSSLEYDL